MIHTVHNAFTGETIAGVELNTWQDVDKALDRANVIHRTNTAGLPVWRRIEILERLAARILECREELALQIAVEGGKPLKDALVEVDRAAQSTKLASTVLAETGGREIPMDLTPAGQGRIAFTRQIPIGPVVAVSAFNHPLNLIAHQVAPAVAANCPVIIKPSMQTPMSCLSYVRLLHESGLPEECCTVVLVKRDVAEQLVSDPRVAFFSFIGSADVGWSLRSKLAPGARCALEHGGVAPVVIAEDACIGSAVESVVKGGFYHAGQVCVSVQRVFAVGNAADTFVDELVEKTSELVTGDPREPDTDVGPLISTGEVDRVSGWVDDAVLGGANLRCGGARISERTYAPTVLIDPPEDSQVAKSEVFGPVVSVFRCATVEEAVSRANDVDASFQAAVFSESLDTALAVAENLRGSAVMVNDHTAFRVDWMPFAGLGTSGLGVGGIKGTYHDMTVEKMTVIRR
ncbi:aldehyde dehydrogenase family protein (plasmid) [Leisingera sp. S132]|uniref:aldehyde dehydrogenase family protein n=1 Tax=Leisingera sp. S132 TaxID=2867016 RepID=UPI001481A77E|nr:aldehyde dehydrogenase family protein [Leisingera sp. S132]UWQ81494.1 aldehyde dehydrogenase family protein [Leisingera sp. S132]